MVVEDNQIDQVITRYQLHKYPVFENVYYHQNGQTAIDYLNEHKSHLTELPDAILLDLSMPVCDGWDVLNAIKAIYPHLVKKLIVYILSASISPVDILRSKSYHFVSEYIPKPLTKEHIFSLSN